MTAMQQQNVHRLGTPWDSVIAAAFDILPTAAMLVSVRGDVLWVNRSARALLRSEESLPSQGAEFRRGTLCSNALLKAIETVIADETARHSSPVFVRLTRSSGRPPLHVAIFSARSLGAGEPDGAAALVMVHDPAKITACHRRAMMEIYGFTRAEAAVAEQMMKGKSPKEIATALYVSAHTVRAHLKKLFAKTNTTRQAELVLLLATGIATLAFSDEG